MGGGGTERVTAALANEFACNGNGVYIYTIVGGESFYSLNQDIVYESANLSINKDNRLTIILSRLIGFFKAFLAMKKLFKKKDYDIVISFLAEADILVGLCKLTGAHFYHVCSERADPFVRNKFKQAVLRRVYNNCSLLVCQSQIIADYYNSVSECNKVVIPNPIDLKNIPSHHVSRTKKIVAVGRLAKQKNFRLLIDGFYDISGEFPDWRLQIYGEGPLRDELQRQILQYDLSERVSLCGAHQDVMERISDAELFIMSSDFEGFPNAMLEAMAIGLPVISTDFATGIARELIKTENGIVVPVNDRKALADAIKVMLCDDDRRSSMGLLNKESAKQFEVSVILKQWEEALNTRGF